MGWSRPRWERPDEGETLETVTDARPIDESRPRDGRADPDRDRRIRMRRAAMVLCLGSIFFAGSLTAVVGRDGYLDLHRKRAQARRLRAEVATLEIEVGVLRHNVDRLENDPLARERVARERFGMVVPGEIEFLLPREDPEVGSAPPSSGSGPLRQGLED